MAWWWIFVCLFVAFNLGPSIFFGPYISTTVTPLSSLPSWPLLASLANFRTSSASLAVTMKDSCQGKRHGDDHHFNQPKKQWHPFLYRKITGKIWPYNFCIVSLFDSPPKKNGKCSGSLSLLHWCVSGILFFFNMKKLYLIYPSQNPVAMWHCSDTILTLAFLWCWVLKFLFLALLCKSHTLR